MSKPVPSESPWAAVRARLVAKEASVPTSKLGRLWRTGRSAGSLIWATLGRNSKDDIDMESADLADIAALVERLGELKGVAMKAGQILGYVDSGLPEEMRGLLSLLQTASPSSPFTAVERTIREALGERADALLASMAQTPIAVASIGQVHRSRVEGRDVVVKVRHPGIEQALTADFATAAVGPLVARAFGAAVQASVSDSVTEAKTAMLEECDFALEAERQTKFGAWLAGHPSIKIPRVLPRYVAGSVLTTEWAPGLTLDEFLARAPTQAARDRAGEALFDLYFGTLYRHGTFHADPHPGNYAFDTEGRVTVYDFGCVRSFDRATVLALSALLSATREDDVEAIGRAFEQLGASPPKTPEDKALVRELVRGFFGPFLERGARALPAHTGFDRSHLMRDKRAVAKLALPGKLLFLFRIRFGLYAVLSRLGAVRDWAALEGSWARHALGRETERVATL